MTKGNTMNNFSLIAGARELEMMDETIYKVKRLAEIHCFDRTKQVITLLLSPRVDLDAVKCGKFASELEHACTPETLHPILRRVLNAVGRRTRFDKDKVSQQAYNIIAKAYISALYETLQLATFMVKE